MTSESPCATHGRPRPIQRGSRRPPRRNLAPSTCARRRPDGSRGHPCGTNRLGRLDGAEIPDLPRARNATRRPCGLLALAVILDELRGARDEPRRGLRWRRTPPPGLAASVRDVIRLGLLDGVALLGTAGDPRQAAPDRNLCHPAAYSGASRRLPTPEPVPLPGAAPAEAPATVRAIAARGTTEPSGSTAVLDNQRGATPRPARPRSLTWRVLAGRHVGIGARCQRHATPEASRPSARRDSPRADSMAWSYRARRRCGDPRQPAPALAPDELRRRGLSTT
jgi:hypothetical protein